MSGVTPKYGLVYYVLGDKYRASDDLDRMTVIDNNLSNLSSIVGDGVLDGWLVTAPPTGLVVHVSIGTGFIGNVVHNTVSIKSATVFDNSTTFVYMKSTMLGVPGGFSLPLESSFSNAAAATFLDVTPPATPTGLTASAPTFDTVLLNWSPNVEPDFSHYVLYRSTDNITFASLGSIFPPAVSYADTKRIGNQIYYYRLAAVDTSANASANATANVTTPSDATLPADVTGLTLYPGNGEMCLVFNPSASSDVIAYLLTLQKLNIDGSVNTTIINGASIVLNETRQLTGLSNNTRYRVRIQAKNVPLNVSPGVIAEATPLPSTAPFDVTALSSASLSGAVSLSWTGSSSATGTAIGQKSSYMVRVISNGATSLPINIGLVTTTTVNSFLLAGTTQFFSENVEYLFRVTTVDAFGNESAGTFVKGSVSTSSVPNSPRNLAAVGGDESAVVTWSHSSSPNIAGYNITYNPGAGFVPEVVLGYVETYTFAPPTDILPNGTPVTIRIRSRDTAGGFSNPITVVVAPEIDTTPPRVPLYVRVNPQDGFVNVTWQANTEPDLAYYVVFRQRVNNPVDSPPNAALSVVAGSSMSFNVGLNTSFVDIGLVNGNVYAYSVAATILRDIISNPPGIAYSSLPSSTTLASPSSGINITDPSVPQVAVPPPTSLTASFSAGAINLGWTHPGTGGITGFNIYRSTSSYSNFSLVASVGPAVFSYSDTGLVNATVYTYMVTAARDNSVPLVESGGIQPANTVLIATVTAVAGNITLITDSQRVVEGLGATISEQTMALLLTHRHSVIPLNGVPTTAVSTLSMIDVSLIQATDISAASLSPAAKSYYTNLITDPITGAAIKIASGTTYVVDPASVTYNVPFIGDFQILVNSVSPTVEFSLNTVNNTLSFASPLLSTDVVILDGQGLTFYVPAAIDLGYQGFDVTVNGGHSVTPFVNEQTQTLTFLSALATTSVVVVTVEPLVPDFGTRVGARQVNLSPDIVLSDFVSTNSTTYTSTSGAFSSTDTVFVLVNGLRSNLDYFVDFGNKAVVFSEPLPSTSVVSLEILGHEEVDPATSLKTSNFGNLDGSQFTIGKFLKPQLPPISHDGRVKELALPLFSSLPTSDRYVYASSEGLVGSGRTPYALTLLPGGDLLVGSSAGVLRTYGAAGILVSQQDNISISNSSLGGNVSFSTPNQIVTAASNAASTSGRISGNVVLSNVVVWPPHIPTYGTVIPSLTLETPSACSMVDGRILITGGRLLTSLTVFPNPPTAHSSPSNLTFIFDPVLNTTREVSPMGTHRQFHAMTTLPGGLVLASGGQDLSSITCVPGPFSNTNPYPNGLAFLRFLSSCELFSPTLETWTPTGSMSQARYNHSANVIDPSNSNSDVLVAGGAWESSIGQWAFNPDPSPNGLWCNDPSTYWTFAELSSAERYHKVGGTWSTTGAMTLQMEPTSSKVDGGDVIVDGVRAREVYDPLAATWSQAAAVSITASLFQGTKVIDGPVKQFFTDAGGNIYAVTRNSIFSSSDGGQNFVAMTGLDSVGVVHAISQSSDGTLFAATDLGVYEISPNILVDMRWFQGGFIGAGTTETFDLQPVLALMLAATEIGLFSSADGGATWLAVGASYGFQNVTNIELIGTNALFIQAGQTLWRSADAGATWSIAGTYPFANSTAKLVARSPLDIFFATDTGLYVSQDGSNFTLVDFDVNRQPTKNNVQMATVVGSDLVVGYDNIIFSVGPDYSVIILAQFSGIVPTVRVNGVEARGGFRYDTVNSLVVFEEKRFSADLVDATANYGLYKLVGDGWYAQRPNAAVQVFVNGAPQVDGTYSTNARMGEVSFVQPLSKTDVVTVSIANTSISDAGELFHDELEDSLEKQKGLPLALGMDYEAAVLQFGLGMDHNFSFEQHSRNSSCLPSGPSLQPFTSRLSDANFYILGRNDFDRFNSTIDYAVQSSQPDIGTAALVGTCLLDVSSTQFWIGSDQGIFVLNPSAAFVVSQNITVGGPGNPVRSLYRFGVDVLAATGNGIWDVTTSTKNLGNGLPSEVFVVSSVNNVLIAGTSDTVYYSDSLSDVPYSTWFRAAFTQATTTTAVAVSGNCAAILSQNGTAYAAIGGSLFSSEDGKAWRLVYSFTDTTIEITAMSFFADSLILGTNKGVYNDDGTARSNVVSFRMELLESTILASTLHINDVFGTAITNTAPGVLYAVGDFPYVYELSSGAWTKSPISFPSATRIAVNAGGNVVVVASNTVIIG